MSCLSEDTVLQFIQGELATAAADEVERHLDACDGCRHLVGQVGQALSSLGPSEGPTAGPTDGGREGGGAEARLARGASVGRYIVLDPIGTGGMGVVYAAYDAELDRKVALKLLRPGAARPGRLAEVRARQLREAQALARVTHPNVIAVYEVGTVGEEVFLAMELVEGTTLDRWLTAPPRSWRAVVAMFLQAGAALAAAHAAGLVHRDFKPQNVLVGRDGRARVVDFGLARQAADPEAPVGETAPADEPRASALTHTGARLGTPAYMAPEQRCGQPVDERTDQYSFCVALHEALHGERPAAAAPAVALGEAVTRGRRAPPRARRVPAWLRRVVRRGLSPAREDRYPSMDALLADLARSHWSRWWTAGAAAVVAITLTLGGIGYRAHLVSERRACRDAESRLAGVWDEARKRRAEAGFHATGSPTAAAAWTQVSARLDAYAAGWVAARTEACEATRLGRQPAELRDLRFECLDWRLEEVRALGTLLEHPDAVVLDRAALAARRLTPVADCAATTVLSRRPRPPRDPQLRARVNAVRVQLTEARILYYAGKLRAAEGIARQAAASARASGHRAIEAEALRAWGQMLINTENTAASEAVLWQAVAAAEASGHDEAKAEALVNLVWVLGVGPACSPARLGEAARGGQQAAATIERLGGDAPRLAAGLAHNLGVLAWARGRFAEAQRHFERALQVFGQESDRLEMAALLQDLGLALAEQGRLAAAASLMEQAIARRERDFGPGHPRLASYLTALAEVWAAQGRPDEALALARRALALTRSGSTGDSLRTSEALGAVGTCLTALGRDVEALAPAREALAVAEKALGPRDPRLARRRDALGDALRRTGQLAAALAEHRRALALLEDTVEPAHPDRARALHGLGVTLLAQRRPADALAPLEQALAIRAPAAIPPADLAATRFALAQALVAAGRDPAHARTLAIQAREGYASAEGRHEATLAAVDRWLAQHARP
ncbi:MAG TPA: serine/threonine-protein kinase [Polyangia bacterium]